MKTAWCWRGAVCCAVMAVSAGLCGCDSRPGPEATVEAQRMASSQPVVAAKTVAAMPGAKVFSTTGPLVAAQQADIAAQRGGRVAEIMVDIGDHVRQGQVMAVLDDRELKVACAEQTAKVASLAAQVKEWQSQQLVDEADLRRADALRADTILSEEDWEHVKYKLVETKSEVARYQADEQGAQADLQAANLQLAQTRIVAPFAGVVGRRELRVAQEVKTGDVLFWITAVAPLRVLFTVPEAEMGAFERGSRLELTTADYPELRQRARVYRVSPVVDPASGSVQVIGEVMDASPLLKPGMTMQVRAR
ncbi:MAG: efflux RND transporter periplasmic adaptor subunit [Acidobacteriaceae bacterium]